MNNQEHLERFVVDNPELEQLEDLLGKFNIFEVLKLQRQEIRHSNFLAWLFDPSGSHGLGSYILKRFLSQSCLKARPLGIPAFSPVDIDVWDLSDTQVFREENQFDVLIVNELHQIVCVVENKLFSGEHGNQLTRYQERSAQIYPQFKRLHVLLSPEGDPPDDEEDQQHWVPMSYEGISRIVEHTILAKESSLSAEVKIFMGHYNEMLRRHVLEDSEVQQLARKIYQTHREAIALINEQSPDATSQIRQIIEEGIEGVPGLILEHSSKGYIRFLPDDWGRFPQLLKGEGWVPSNRLLLFQFNNGNNYLKLFLIIGPGDEDIRNEIFNSTIQHDQVFKSRKKSLTSRWTTIFSKNFLTTSDYVELDMDSIQSKFDTRMKSFVADDLPFIDQHIKELFGSPGR